MAQVRGRIVRVNQTILDQADFFQADGFTRVAGLTTANVELQVFYDNLLQPWILTEGVTVSDTQVVSGRVYFHEITGTSGNYSLRFRPNSPGYWRVILSYPVGQQILAQDYDVTAEPLTIKQGLTASFTNC